MEFSALTFAFGARDRGFANIKPTPLVPDNAVFGLQPQEDAPVSEPTDDHINFAKKRRRFTQLA
jgi:hypothetical protein